MTETEQRDLEYLDLLPSCKNCGQSIHEHEKESEPAWMCPYEYQPGTCYGFFHGGDPRDFSPDHEMCSDEEIKRHKEACAQADKLERFRDLPCPSGWERNQYGLCHILRAPFGIGVMSYPPMFYEADYGKPSPDQKELFEEDSP